MVSPAASYNGFSFGRFVRRYPHLKGPVTDLLIGDLFKPELDQVFEAIDAMRSETDVREPALATPVDSAIVR